MKTISTVYLPFGTNVTMTMTLPKRAVILNVSLSNGAPVMQYLSEQCESEWIEYQVIGLIQGQVLPAEESLTDVWGHVGSVEQLHFFFRSKQ